MKLPLLLRCVRCGCDDTVRMWTADPLDCDFSLCGCQGNLAYTPDDIDALVEQAQDKLMRENGPEDSDLPTFDEALAASLPRHGGYP